MADRDPRFVFGSDTASTSGERGQMNSTTVGNLSSEGIHGDSVSPVAVQRVVTQKLSSPAYNESPLHRAGLLQPRSYASSQMHVAHSQEDIRSSTMQISNMFLSPPGTVPDSPSPSPQFIFPQSAGGSQRGSIRLSASLASPSLPKRDADISSSIASSTTGITVDTSVSQASDRDPAHITPIPEEEASTPRAGNSRNGSPIRPSGLSLMLARNVENHGHASKAQLAVDGLSGSSSLPTPKSEAHSDDTPKPPSLQRQSSSKSAVYQLSHSPSSAFLSPNERDIEVQTETTPLLTIGSRPRRIPAIIRYGALLKWKSLKAFVNKHSARKALAVAVTSLPAVLLGCLLNILDGVSYGMIIFPSSGLFADLGGMGVSMFFVSAIVSQLVYTLGGSGFAGANGSMMIEVVPFFHILANSIASQIGEDKPREVIATTLVAYALSSILTGLCFFLLGALRLGVIIGFFPRHILVGCIGGVGAFLIETGLTVSMRIEEDELGFQMFEARNLVLWVPAMALAVLLRLITSKFHHQLIFPIYFLIIPVIFYIVVAAAGLDLNKLRTAGWLFDVTDAGDEKWYTFYTYFDFSKVWWTPIWKTMPTQFALLFFNILHPPLNVPALSVSLDEDVDTNKELVAHGYSNFLSGLCGSVPNYLVYVNTLLFYRVGGGTRIAGFLLAMATIFLLVIGTGPIAYIPVMVVGALIFVLGIDLVKEALWDPRHRVSRSEYITIISIMVCMTVWDFVVGVLFGIVVSCFFFVVQNSQRRSIRALHTGETALSTVRRPSSHRAYIREVSKQTTILRLQGFLFFGTITYVEESIRDIMEGNSWQKNPVRFLVIDLSLVLGIDMSAAEAFVRIHRLLTAKRVVLVFCGFSEESSLGQALKSVGVLGAEHAELFETFGDAMEWTENTYLMTWFKSQKVEATAVALPGRQDLVLDFQSSLANSPRRSQIRDVGNRTMSHDQFLYSSNEPHPSLDEPYNTIVKAFSSYDDINPDDFPRLISYLERIRVPRGTMLWAQDDEPDALYLVESGVLRASYRFADYAVPVQESMVPGTIAGELSALSGLPRNATITVERDATLWKLSIPNLRRLESDHPDLARCFTQLVLKAAKMDYDILLSALATRQ